MDDKQVDNIVVNLETKRTNFMKYAKAMTNIPIDEIVKSAKSAMKKKYSKEEIKRYIEQPQKNEDKLREVVDYLCTISPQFCALIEYIPNMALITPFVKQRMNLSTKSKRIKLYEDMCIYADSLSMRSNGLNILKEVFKYGVYYGIEIEGEYSTFIKRLEPKLCKIISVGESGLSIAFDCSYFDNNEYILDNGYPKEFRKMYNTYKANKKTLEGLKLEAKWQPVPDEISIVVKYDLSVLDYSVPPYVSVFNALYDLEEYQALNKAKVTAENYTLIGLKIPIKKDSQGADEYLVSDDMIEATTMMLEDSLPEYMGYFTTPTDIETIKASTSSDSKVDQVANATENVFNSFGYAPMMFGVKNDNSSTLEYSVMVDQQKLFPIYRQLETHWDYKLKAKYKDNFKLKLLDITWFNLKEMLSYYKDNVQWGVPIQIVVPLILGYDMSDLNDMVLMQEEIFDTLNKWIPPKSSYTQNSNEVGEPGSPKKDGKDLSPSGEQTRKNDGNSR